ncbi:hypothetical protein FOI42_RS02765 [Escherichia coli]|nr:hypothetical protein [Escherichia coli]EFL4883460.1 hypothetical protein [Escherichia coli]MED6699225.1 hypothetical protein [Escherichia coli O157]USL83864.1 hypothetical protein A4_197 [Escherichia phage A4]HCQ0858759.1 hypothetical protein [Escherichia coli]
MNLYLVEGTVQVFRFDGDRGMRFSHVEEFKFVVHAEGEYEAEIKVSESFDKKETVDVQYQQLQFKVWPTL